MAINQNTILSCPDCDVELPPHSYNLEALQIMDDWYHRYGGIRWTDITRCDPCMIAMQNRLYPYPSMERTMDHDR